MQSNFYCLGSPTLLGTFDLSYAPTLIFYAYIPIILVSLFLGIFVLFKDKYSIQSKLLFLIAVLFSLWNLNIILEWVTVPVNLNLFFSPFASIDICVSVVPPEVLVSTDIDVFESPVV
jgi:hypothetical protein